MSLDLKTQHIIGKHVFLILYFASCSRITFLQAKTTTTTTTKTILSQRWKTLQDRL